ncbi:uncharacterized protein LOC124690221 [Lolium rigidum]|uniref:uncharacterized protein LOC124690221 n=1 Tax=Lolium rigidum TaxID=89674 RepID=UPI001F5C7C43|nr:uncharacterized protein LOC124690221 [Lolium rigidum]
MGSSGQEFVGGVGRVGGQGSAATDDGGKGTQCKNTKQNQRKKLNGSSLIKEKCQKVVKSQDKQRPDYRGRNTKPASAGLRSPKLTSSPGVNFLVRSAAAKRAKMAGSPKTPQPPSCSQIGSPSLHDLSPDTAAANSHENQDKEYTFAPLNSEWDLAEAVMKVLEVFYTATETLSGTKYKYDFLEFLLSDFGSEKEAETWMGEVKDNMQKLFNEYNKEVESQREWYSGSGR